MGRRIKQKIGYHRPRITQPSAPVGLLHRDGSTRTDRFHRLRRTAPKWTTPTSPTFHPSNSPTPPQTVTGEQTQIKTDALVAIIAHSPVLVTPAGVILGKLESGGFVMNVSSTSKLRVVPATACGAYDDSHPGKQQSPSVTRQSSGTYRIHPPRPQATRNFYSLSLNLHLTPSVKQASDTIWPASKVGSENAPNRPRK